jgi:hypothetical protein
VSRKNLEILQFYWTLSQKMQIRFEGEAAKDAGIHVPTYEKAAHTRFP